MPRTALRAVPVLALIIVAGCSAPVARSSCTVPAGSFAEMELDIAAGTVLSWDWSAGAELDFLIGTGADDLEEIYAVDGVRNDTDEEPLEHAGLYSVTWSNWGDSDVTVDYLLKANGKAVGEECSVPEAEELV